MDPKQSLIAKIAGKGVITPYEAIHLQYLNKLYIQEQVPDIERWGNLYIAVENVSELFSQYDLKNILSFQSLQEASLYDAYRWTANYMVRLDAHSENTGYKTLALFNKLRWMQSEHIMRITRDARDNKPIEGNLFEFAAYSQIHEKIMTFEQVVASFTECFSFLIISIDCILTLNYYLRTMVVLGDFNCLKFLPMLLAEEEQTTEDDDRSLNIARLCYEQIANLTIETNHEKFTELMKRQFASFNIILDSNFQESSLFYVKKSIPEITDIKI